MALCFAPPKDGGRIQHHCSRGFGRSLVLPTSELGDEFAHAQVPAIRFRQHGYPACIGILETIDGLLRTVEPGNRPIGSCVEGTNCTRYGTLVDHCDIAPTSPTSGTASTSRKQENKDQDRIGCQSAELLHRSPFL